jgi:hypothetical protein
MEETEDAKNGGGGLPTAPSRTDNPSPPTPGKAIARRTTGQERGSRLGGFMQKIGSRLLTAIQSRGLFENVRTFV